MGRFLPPVDVPFETPGNLWFRVIGQLPGLSTVLDHRLIMELNDQNKPQPDDPESDGLPNVFRQRIRQ